MNTLSIIENYAPKELPKSYTFHFKNKEGNEATHEITNPEQVKMLCAVDSLTAIMRGGDVRLAILFAKLDRQNAFKYVELKTMSAMIQSYWHFEKSTANSYLAIGKAFFDHEGNEKIEGIGDFSLGQLLPLVALVKEYPTICGFEIDNNFMSHLIHAGFLSPNMTTKEVKGIADTLKASYLPKKWVNKDQDGYFAEIDGITFRFDDCPYCEEVTENKPDKADNKPNKATSNDSADDTTSDNENPQESPIDALMALLASVDLFDMDASLRKEWDKAKKSVELVLEKLDK